MVCLLCFTDLVIVIVPVSNDRRLSFCTDWIHNSQSMVSIQCLPLILSSAELNERLSKVGPNTSGMRRDVWKGKE